MNYCLKDKYKILQYKKRKTGNKEDENLQGGLD